MSTAAAEQIPQDFDTYLTKAQDRVLQLAAERKDPPPEDFRQDAAIEKLWLEANCPERHSKAKLSEGPNQWVQTLNKVLRREPGYLIALVGIRGNGKTQLAVELIRERTNDLKPARFCSATEFFMTIKAGYSSDSPELETIKAFTKPFLLVIDELGKRSENQWENLLLFELLNRRYNAMKDTLIISNQGRKEAEDSLGASIVSRMNETGGFIECDWPSFRV